MPYDDNNTPENESLDIEIIAERTWELTGSENESPEFEIDPTQNPPTRNGYYTILFRPISANVSGIGEAGKDVTGDDTNPGKVVLINDGDADNDGIPDYADGYNLRSEIEADEAVPGASFVPIHVSFYAIDPENAKIKFTYSASDPMAVTATSTNPYQLPANGKMRLWMKNANGGWTYNPTTYDYDFAQRDGRPVSQGGDFIESGVEYTLEDLGIHPDDYYYYYDYGNGLTVYAEIVKTSDAVADIPVKVEIKPTANLGYVFSDQVRFTGVAAKLLQRSPRQDEFDQASRFAVSRVTKAPTETSLTVDEDFLPGAYQEFKIQIHDPRQTLTELQVRGQSVPLQTVQGALETPPFIGRRFNASQDISGTPQLSIILASGNTPIDFNPILPFDSTGKVNNMSVDQRNLSREIDNVISGLKPDWSPTTYGYLTTDTGAFGKEVHKQVGAPYQNRQGWIVGGYFEKLPDGRHKYLGTIQPPDLTGTTEVDIMRLKKGYRLQEGAILNKNKVEFIADIKTTAAGKLSFDGPLSQGQRLLLIVGGDKKKLNIVVPYDRWTPSRGWFRNNRFLAISAIFSTAGIAGSVWNAMHAHEFEEDFGHVLTTARQVKLAIDRGDDYDLQIKPLLIQYRIQIHNYLSYFMPLDEVNTLATVSELYRIMATSNVDWLDIE